MNNLAPETLPTAASTSKNALSDDLRRLAGTFGRRPIAIAELLSAANGSGHYLLLLLICLPFVTPVPLPVVSLPFGLVVAAIGSGLLSSNSPWLPKAVSRRQVSPEIFNGFIRISSRVVRGLEYLVRPRYGRLRNRRIEALLIVGSGLFMAIPIPLPFSNSLPAWTVIFLSAGALGRDGIFFVAGCGAFLVNVAYLAAIAFGGAHGIDLLIRYFFPPGP